MPSSSCSRTVHHEWLHRRSSLRSSLLTPYYLAPHSSICLSSSSSFLYSPSISDSFTQFFFYRSTSSLHALHSFTSIYSSPTHLITRLASILLLTASCSSTPPLQAYTRTLLIRRIAHGTRLLDLIRDKTIDTQIITTRGKKGTKKHHHMIMMSMLEASSNKKSLCSSRSNARKTPKTTPPAESDEVFKIQQERER